ncbi:vWA domain-containing protein [Coralloluteibacterium stylophorae]|uniref:VWA domain-containing protein n=1 Tax=Coralloluteibacterium stylophorae TaxID=1776034 RepID=A0A8J7VVG9_9GAMM|nr:VWA domain-containing protein [Coralloluteibacterium stylophorae]MBS7458388.1 VWA domain-containing protein [Coralloluteibacterium stylophorae]
MSALGGLSLAWPWLLLALPLPWLAARLLPPAPDTSAALRVPFARQLAALDDAGPAHGARWRWLPLLAWALLCLAASRPQTLGEVVQPPQSGRDLMLAVDLSGSMAEPDMQLGGRPVERLTAAKAVLGDFLDRREGDRVGLILFGQRAYAVAPLTLDRETIRQQLDDTVVGLAGRETAIGDAIGLAVKRLREQPEGQRVLVLLTDGVNNVGALEPRKAGELAAAAGVRVHTIGFGGDGSGLASLFGMRVPGAGAGGDEIDEATLQAVAAETGGRYFRARDTAELAGIYAELDRIEPVERAGEVQRPRRELYVVPLAAAALCMLLGLATALLSRGWNPGSVAGGRQRQERA